MPPCMYQPPVTAVPYHLAIAHYTIMFPILTLFHSLHIVHTVLSIQMLLKGADVHYNCNPGHEFYNDLCVGQREVSLCRYRQPLTMDIDTSPKTHALSCSIGGNFSSQVST